MIIGDGAMRETAAELGTLLGQGLRRSDREGHIPAATGLPDGRTLTVREIRPADVEGLGTLFGRLGEEERYHRFFQLSCPGRRFLGAAAGLHQPEPVPDRAHRGEAAGPGG